MSRHFAIHLRDPYLDISPRKSFEERLNDFSGCLLKTWGAPGGVEVAGADDNRGESISYLISTYVLYTGEASATVLSGPGGVGVARGYDSGHGVSSRDSSGATFDSAHKVASE